MPRVSVVIPSYNHAPFIAEAVHSVLRQSLGDLELIVVDDGSTDESLQILAGFTDRRLCVIAQSNQGAHAAFNRGLAEASGKYIALLNSDDMYHPQRLEKLVAVLEADPGIGLASSHITVIDAQDKALGAKHGYHDLEPWLLESWERSFRAGEDLRAALLTENYLATTSNYVFARQRYEQVGGFRPLRYTHDWDFALRFARVARLAMVPEPLLRYRVHGHNTIRENRAAMIFEICWILAVHLPQHIADTWFGELALSRRVDQLLHSIYTYDCDRVLNVMLANGLSNNERLALQLLAPDDPTRLTYLEFIGRHVGKPGEPNHNLIQRIEYSIGAGLPNLISRLRAKIQPRAIMNPGKTPGPTFFLRRTDVKNFLRRIKSKAKRILSLTRSLAPASSKAVFDAVQYPGVFGRIHRYDFMIGGTSPEMLDHYKRVGAQACGLVEEALTLINQGLGSVNSVLDFGCGYGRVTRALAQRVEPKRVSVFDVDPGATAFCIAEFGVKTVPFTNDWNAVRFGTYDAIWVGSVFTHLSESNTARMLRLLCNALSRNGVLVFTTHGEEALRRMARGDYGKRFQTFEEQVRKEYAGRGFSFIPFTQDELSILPFEYKGDADFGMTWMSESYVKALMQDISKGDLQFLKFTPQGWDYHQDVFFYHRVK